MMVVMSTMTAIMKMILASVRPVLLPPIQRTLLACLVLLMTLLMLTWEPAPMQNHEALLSHPYENWFCCTCWQKSLVWEVQS